MILTLYLNIYVRRLRVTQHLSSVYSFRGYKDTVLISHVHSYWLCCMANNQQAKLELLSHSCMVPSTI